MVRHWLILYFLLVIFEGVLRKWVVPDLNRYRNHEFISASLGGHQSKTGLVIPVLCFIQILLHTAPLFVHHCKGGL